MGYPQGEVGLSAPSEGGINGDNFRMKRLLIWAAALSFFTGAHALTTGPSQQGAVAYPPSCLAWPIWYDLPSGPTWSRSTLLAVLDRTTLQQVGHESVDFTFWRVPCDGGRSAVMLRISRAPAPNLNRLVQFPPVPGLAIRQGSITHVVRLAEEPNTQNSSLVPGSLISGGVTLVLEHFFRIDPINGGALKPGGGSQGLSDPYIDFNQALDVTIPAAPDIGLSPIPPPLSIPAYDPSQYPAASMPLPVTGYNAGSYFDPAHPGEGMLVGVMGDLAGDFMLPKRVITLAWFTYDQGGRPFWLYGSAVFDPGARGVTVPLGYYANGGFAGASTAGRLPWGTVTVSFPDCTAMRFTYAANANLPAPVPSGSGDRTWARLTQENGLSCR